MPKFLTLVNDYNILMHEEPFREQMKEDILAGKAASGKYDYIIQGPNYRYFIMLYKGLIPITKADTVNIRVLENPNMPTVFAANFITTKKKEKLIFNQYMAFRKL
jgi:hypothetical protein